MSSSLNQNPGFLAPRLIVILPHCIRYFSLAFSLFVVHFRGSYVILMIKTTDYIGMAIGLSLGGTVTRLTNWTLYSFLSNCLFN